MRPADPAHAAATSAILRALGEIMGEPGAAGAIPPGLDPVVLGQAAFSTGTGPLLGWWIENGRLTCREEIALVLRRHLDHSRRRAELIARDLLQLSDELRPQGVNLTVIKGFHSAREYFPEAGCRPTSDVDVLVSPENVDTAKRALTHLGYRCGATAGNDLRTQWYRGDQSLVELDFSHVDNPRSIDLHHTLRRTVDPGATFRFAANIDELTAPWDRFDGRFRRLRQPFLTALLATHCCERLRDTQLIRIVELTLVLRRDCAGGALTWADLEDLVMGSGLERFVYPGFALVELLAPGSVDPGFIASLRSAVTSRLRRVVDATALASVQHPRARSLDEELMYAQGAVPVLRILARKAFPLGALNSPRELPSRIWGRAAFLARGGFSLRARRPEGP